MEAGKHIYDCVVVGGGPAGLSAALYMGRMRRSVMVIDDHEGRSTWHQVNRNYVGFPDGIHASKLREIGKEQASRYGVEFFSATVDQVRAEGEGRERCFYFDTTRGQVVSRTVILATGVTDKFPEFEGSIECIGKSMFWCIICDGYETIDKRIVIFGHNNRAASLALEMLVFTKEVTLVSWDDPFNLTPEKMSVLEEHGITVYDSECELYKCAVDGQLESVVLTDGTEIPLDSLFVAQHIEPNTQLAEQLGMALDEHGFIMTDVELCTNVDGAYAAGDVTKLNNHQVSSAVHEGGMAAAAANYYLYEDWQKD
ncbi:MAG: NAD(P)/FAD-dependent oxidoreductase [Chloroflexota bacterium]